MNTNSSKKSIFVAWDRMNAIWFRYWTNYEEKGKTLRGEASKEHQERFKREVHFLIKSSCDLEFHQYLNRRLDYTKEKGRKEVCSALLRFALFLMPFIYACTHIGTRFSKPK